MNQNLLQNLTTYTPSWTKTTAPGTKYFRAKACTSNNCATSCTDETVPAESGITPVTGLQNGASYYICIQHELVTGKKTDFVPSNFYVTIDTTAPFISSNPITMPANGIYTFGQNLDFVMTTSEVVSVVTDSGTPRIALDISSETHYALYIDADGSGGDLGSSLRFRYTVDSSVESYSGIGVTDTIDINGGEITDLATNNLVLTFVSDATDAIFVDNKEPTDPSGITPIFPIIHNALTYTPTWTSSYDGSFDYHEMKACGNSDCSTSCLSVVSPATSGSTDITGLVNGSSYYICVRGVDKVGLMSPFVSSVSYLTVDTSAGTSYFLTAGVDNITADASDNNIYDLGEIYYNGTSDTIDGVAGTNVLHLGGDYSSGTTIGSNVSNVDKILIYESGVNSSFTIDGAVNLNTVDASNGSSSIISIDAFTHNDPITIFGSNGGSIIHGGTAADTITGGASSDTIYGEFDGDTIDGGDGDDHLYPDGPAFTKNSVAGMTAWFNPNIKRTLIYSNTGAVNGIFDLSGSGNHLYQETTVNQPSLVLNYINGRQVLSFASHRLQRDNVVGTDLISADELSFFFTKFYAGGVSGNLVTWRNGVQRCGYGDLTNGQMLFDIFDGVGGTAETRVSIIDLAYVNRWNTVMNVRYPSTLQQLYVNGENLAEGLRTDILDDSVTGTLTWGGPAGVSYNGFLADLIIFQRGLSDYEKKRISEYQMNYWGITYESTYDFGQDFLTGGLGDDIFYFNNATYSPNATPDHITDFGAGSDKIDLSGFDEEIYVHGANGFQTSGQTELIWRDNGGSAMIDIDWGGDATPDFTIQLDGYTHTNLGFDKFIFKNVVGDASDNIIQTIQTEDSRVTGGYGGDIISTGSGNDLIYPDNKPFYRNSVANIVFWLDSSNPLGDFLPYNDSTIDVWYDLSGNNINARASNDYPFVTRNVLSRSTMDFTGDDNFKLDNFYKNNKVSAFFVVQLDRDDISSNIYNFKKLSPENTDVVQLSGGSFQAYHFDGSVNSMISSPVVQDNLYVLDNKYDDGLDYHLFSVNGSTQYFTFIGHTLGYTVNGGYLGSHDTGVNYLDGKIPEFLYFNQVTSTSDTNFVREYISMKYDSELSGQSFGVDNITVGDGDDRIVLTNAWHSGIGASSDVITDFNDSGTDKIVLMNMPEIYSFIGTSAFSAGNSPELRSEISGADTYLQFDFTGDGTVDREVLLQNYTSLTSSDIMQVGGEIYFDVTLSSLGANVSSDITITAKDLWGNTVDNYVGIVNFRSSDASASLPADYSFTSTDDGTKTFSSELNMTQTGAQTIIVSDVSDASIYQASLFDFIDITPPYISGSPITMPADGVYIETQNLDFILIPSEVVVVSGTPRIALDIGGTTKYADYLDADGAGGDTGGSLRFRYTVETNLDDYSGIAVTELIDLNGGTIIDTAGNAMTPLSFTADATSGILVDSTAPASVIVTLPAWPIVQDTSSFGPVTWTGGTDSSFDRFTFKACSNTGCSANCLALVDPATSGVNASVDSLVDGRPYYMCVEAFDNYTHSTLGVSSFTVTFDSTVGASYTLTSGVDNFTGDASNNTFYDPNSTFYNATADTLDGGAGIDTLQLMGNYSTQTEIASNISNIENLSLVESGYDYNILITDPTGMTTVDATKITSETVTIDAFRYTSPLTIYGGDSGNTINGSKGSDTIYGGSSDDTIYGELGGDNISGDSGNDHIYPDGPRFLNSSVSNMGIWWNIDNPFGRRVYSDGTKLRVAQISDLSGNDISIFRFTEIYAPVLVNNDIGGRSSFDMSYDNLDLRLTAYNVTGSSIASPTGIDIFYNQYIRSPIHNGHSFTYGPAAQIKIHPIYTSGNSTFFDFTDGSLAGGRISADISSAVLDDWTIFEAYRRPDTSAGVVINGSLLIDGVMTDTFDTNLNFNLGLGTGFDGKFSEIFFFNNSLSLYDRERVEEYLLNHWIRNGVYPHGQDYLTGGLGNDIFYFNTSSYSPSATPDHITDFGTGSDLIDLTGFYDEFYVSGPAGLRTSGKTEIAWRDSGGNALIDMDWGGDGTADFTIQLDGYAHTGLDFDKFIFKNVVGDSSDNTIQTIQTEDTRVTGGYGGDTISTGSGNDLIYPDNKPFYRDSISNLLLWFDASNINGDLLATTTGQKSVWYGLAGNGVNASNDTTGPSLEVNADHGRYNFYFDGTTNYFSIDSHARASNSGSFYWSGNVYPKVPFRPFYSANNTAGKEVGSYGNGTAISAYVWQGSFYGNTALSSFTKSENLIQGYVYNRDSTTAYMKFDGSIVNTVATATLDLSDATINRGRFGSHYNGNDKMEGLISEFLYFDSALATSDTLILDQYLAMKYNVEVSGDSFGVDNITVGGGDDRIVFTNAWHSGTGATADVITDFNNSGNDKIVLMNMPEIYTFINTSAFSAAGSPELRSEISGADTYLQFDFTGDGTVDREIFLQNYTSLTSSDIMQVGGETYFDIAMPVLTAGTSNDVVITAKDLWGNTVTNYNGTVSLRSSDLYFESSGNYTFTYSDTGTKTLSGWAKFAQDGDQTLIVEDISDAAIYQVAKFTLIDSTPPTFMSPMSMPADGYFVESDNMDFTLTTSEVVTINTGGGTPQLELTIGGQTKYASYVDADASGGNIGSVIRFRYTVDPSLDDQDGIDIVGSVDASGGIISDLTGNAMVDFTFTADATAGILVDSTPPTSPVVTLPAWPIYQDSTMYFPTWTSGTDSSLDRHILRACENNDCATNCLPDVDPATSGNSTADNLTDGASFYMCVGAYDHAGNNTFASSRWTVTVDTTMGAVFTLTGGADSFTGDASNNVFYDPNSSFYNGTSDVLDGAGGTDILQLMGDYSSQTTIASNISNIEILSLIDSGYDYNILITDPTGLTTVDATSVNGEFVTIDAFSYKSPLTIYGGQSGNLIKGSKGHDTIYGGASDDIIYGEYGGDTIDGGDGNDHLYPDAYHVDLSQMGTLLLWMDVGDPDNRGYIHPNETPHGDTVYGWFDKSGNGHYGLGETVNRGAEMQHNVTKMGGHSAFYFDDTNSEWYRFRSEFMAFPDPSLFIVVDASNSGTFFSDYGNPAGKFMNFMNSAGSPYWVRDASSNVIVSSPLTMPYSFPSVRSMRKSGQTVYSYANGSSDSVANASFDAATTWEGVYSTGPVIGNHNNYGLSVKLNGWMTEFFIYNSFLGDVTTDRINEYLAYKYSIDQTIDGLFFGQDILTGGLGDDTFHFGAGTFSSNATPDHITDFGTGTDLIDLSGFDEELTVYGDAGLQGSGKTELAWRDNGGNAMIDIDWGGDGTADFTIQLDSYAYTSLSVRDFIFKNVINNTTPDTLTTIQTENTRVVGGYGGDTISTGSGNDLIYPDDKPFYKDTVSNLQLWLDGSDPNNDRNRPADGETVSIWKNKGLKPFDTTTIDGSPNINYQAFDFNGRPGIYFNNTLEFYTLGSNYIFATGDGLSIYAGTRRDKSSDRNIIIDFGAYAGGNYMLWYNFDFPEFITHPPLVASSNVTSDLSTFRVLGGVVEFGGVQSIYGDGTLEGTTDASALVTISSAEIAEQGIRGPFGGPVTIGAHSKTAVTRHFEGDMGDVLLFDKFTKYYDQKTIEHYLAMKYGRAHSDAPLGVDNITVGAGDDRIVLTNAWYSGIGASADVITDFNSSGTDKIVLMNMSEIYSFINTSAFSATGQAEMRNEVSGSDSYLQIDINGDGTSDREIFLQNYTSLTSSDIMQVGGETYFDIALEREINNATGDITVTAKDLWGNTVTSYLGTISFTSTDATGSVPSNYTFTPSDAGTHTFTDGAYFSTTGTQLISVTDGSSASITNTEAFSITSSLDITSDISDIIYHLTGASDPLTQSTSLNFNFTITSTNALTDLTCKVTHLNMTLKNQNCDLLPSLKTTNSVIHRDYADVTVDVAGKAVNITWVPTYDQRGTYKFRVAATDGIASTYKDIFVTVREDISTDNLIFALDGYMATDSTSEGFTNIPFKYQPGGGDLNDWLNLTGYYNGDLSSHFVTGAPWVGIGSTTPYAAKILEKGPIGYWRLGDATGATTVIDYSGNGLHGTAVNGPVFGAKGSLVGDHDSAAEFSVAATNYVSLGTNSLFDMGSGDFTVMGWYTMPSDITEEGHLFMKGSYGVGGIRYRLFLDTTEHAVIEIDDNTALKKVTSANTLNDGMWRFIVGVRDGNNLRLYIDGSEDSNSPTDITAYGSLDDAVEARIGRGSDNVGGTNYYLDGTADEIALFNRALTATEIAELYTLGKMTEENVPHALTFDGANDYIDLSTPFDSEASTTMLFSTWIKLDDATAAGKVILGNGGGAGNGFELSQSSVAPGHLELKVGAAQTSAYAETVEAYKPIGYWRLGDATGSITAVDSASMMSCSTGTAQCDGTYTAGPTLEMPGAIQNDSDFAVFFDESSDQYVDIGDDLALRQGATDLTIMGWFNATADFSDTTGIFARSMFGMGRIGPGGKRFLITIGGPTSGEVTFYTDDNVTQYDTNSTGQYNDGNWHFVTGVKEGNWIKLYVDGTEDGSPVNIAGQGSLDDPGYGFKIGYMVATNAVLRHFHGYLDEVAVFNYALTYDQQKAIYEAGANNRCISGTLFESGKWYNVAGMYDGTNAYLYVNGKLECAVGATNFASPATGLFAGAASGGANFWDGAMSNLFLYGTTGATVGSGASIFDIYNKTVNQTRVSQIEDIYTGSNLIFHFDAANMLDGNETTTDTCPTGLITEISQYRNKGEPLNFSSCSSVSGILGSGRSGDPFYIYFDGTDDLITFPYIPQYNFKSGDTITIEFWAKYVDPGWHGTPITSQYNFSDPNGINWRINLHGSDPGFQFEKSDGSASTVLRAGASVNDGTWHHHVVTHTYGTGAGANWYFDGVELTTESWSGSDGATTVSYQSATKQFNVTLGGAYQMNTGGFYVPYRGGLAIMRVYREQLTLEQVKQNCLAQQKRFSADESICASP